MKSKLNIVYIILMFILVGLLPFSMVAQKPSKAAPLCEKAKQAMRLQDFVKAMSYLNQAQYKDPNYADIYIMKGDIFNFTLRSDSAMAINVPLTSLVIRIRCSIILRVMRARSAAHTNMR